LALVLASGWSCSLRHRVVIPTARTARFARALDDRVASRPIVQDVPVVRMRFDDREVLMVEVYNDVAVRRCPLTLSESLAMLSDVKGARLLRGFRGRPPADVVALADTLVRVSWLAVHLAGHLAELDINPLMVLPAGHGVKAVDALAVLPSA